MLLVVTLKEVKSGEGAQNIARHSAEPGTEGEMPLYILTAGGGYPGKQEKQQSRWLNLIQGLPSLPVPSVSKSPLQDF